MLLISLIVELTGDMEGEWNTDAVNLAEMKELVAELQKNEAFEVNGGYGNPCPWYDQQWYDYYPRYNDYPQLEQQQWWWPHDPQPSSGPSTEEMLNALTRHFTTHGQTAEESTKYMEAQVERMVQVVSTLAQNQSEALQPESTINPSFMNDNAMILSSDQSSDEMPSDEEEVEAEAPADVHFRTQVSFDNCFSLLLNVDEGDPGPPLDDEGEIVDMSGDLELSQDTYLRPHLPMLGTLKPRASLPHFSKCLKGPHMVKRKKKLKVQHKVSHPGHFKVKKKGWYDKRVRKRRGVRSYCVRKKRGFLDEMAFEGPSAG